MTIRKIKEGWSLENALDMVGFSKNVMGVFMGRKLDKGESKE